MVTAFYCNQCGHRNPDGSNFCSSCGAVLERRSPDEPTTRTIVFSSDTGDSGEEEVVVNVDDLSDASGALVVKRGPTAGSRFTLHPEVTTIGRHPESDIFLDDITVSRRHAEIKAEPGRFTVRDVGSLNGTYLNRQRIEQATLSNGDELQIGKFRLVFLADVKGG